MESKATFLGHPVHPMLIVFPLELLATAVAFDIVALARGEAFWFVVSFWMIAAGIIGALLAAVFGLIDWLAIPSGTRAKAIGLWHGGGNLVVVLLFIASWFLRRPAHDRSDLGDVSEWQQRHYHLCSGTNIPGYRHRHQCYISAMAEVSSFHLPPTFSQTARDFRLAHVCNIEQTCRELLQYLISLWTHTSAVTRSFPKRAFSQNGM